MSDKKITRIGVGGPVGSGKTAIIEAITPMLLDMGVRVVIITNDIVTTEDAKQVKRTLKGILDEEDAREAVRADGRRSGLVGRWARVLLPPLPPRKPHPGPRRRRRPRRPWPPVPCQQALPRALRPRRLPPTRRKSARNACKS